MIATLNELTAQYKAALGSYLTGIRGEAGNSAGDDALERAYEIGRRAIAEGVGVLDMASIHNQSLAAMLGRPLDAVDAATKAARASIFFAESLSPFEMVLRGYREANEQLRSNLRQLEAAERALQKQNQDLAAAHQLVAAERHRYQELFHFAPGGYLVTDLDGTIQEANNPAARLLGAAQRPLAGSSLLRSLSEADRDEFRRELDKLRSGEIERIQEWQTQVQGSAADLVPVSLRAELVRDPEGNPAALRWLISDISERRQMEEERAQIRIREHLARADTEAARRFRFLAEASSTLTNSLDYETILASIARLPLPYLADFCAVHFAGDAGSLQQVVIVHADPKQAQRIERLQALCSRRQTLPPALAAVVEANAPQFISEVSDSWLEQFAGATEPAEIMRELELGSLLALPLTGQKPLGTITLGRGTDKPGFSVTDRSLAEDFARRCSLVLDNATLHSQVIVERDRAGKASQAKDEFVAILSHELRTPLMAILGWVRVLKKLPSTQTESVLNEGVHILEHNAGNVARLIEDCLDIARITERKIHLRKEHVDLNQLLRTAVEASRKTVQNKELHFLLHLSPGSLWVSGDRTRLEQVVSNLLSNALRYTGDGGTVTIESVAKNNEAEVSVQDTGIGIAPEMLEQIFQPFRQGTQHWLASESGLGLGLAIARQIVQIHGGRISAESQGSGTGSTFRFQLPLTNEYAAVPEAIAFAAQIEPVQNLQKILLIEDSVDILNLMRIELGELGYDVLTAKDALTGLELAYRQHPRVIVSDIKMPGMDGYEFIRQLRKTPELRSIPTIALTGFGMKRDIERALEAGYDAHVCKPVEVEHLSILIKKMLSK